jgi:hypothetical protein
MERRQIQKPLVRIIHIGRLESTIWGEVCAMFSISKIQKLQVCFIVGSDDLVSQRFHF